ncbi:hypothetical protein MCL92_11470, partial [Providencia rettgeri]|uniref:hypothetical protein n=1 Tax=Providencia rettgeri TaxID=587 RepID=UPI001EFD21B9
TNNSEMLSTEVKFCLKITYQMTKKYLPVNLHLLSMQKSRGNTKQDKRKFLSPSCKKQSV